MGHKNLEHNLEKRGILSPSVQKADLTAGDYNYFIHDNGNILRGVKVTINFDEDFTYPSGGISFQLNCYSQDATNVRTTWQQYVIRETQGSNELTAFINNYSGTDSSFAQVINIWPDPVFASLPSSNTIQAGYSLTIALNYDSAGNVNGATYSASDNNGQVIGDTTINILDQFFWNEDFETSTKVTTAYLAPIVAIVLNIGGWGGGATAPLTEGAGTIIYESTNDLIPMVGEPAFTVWGTDRKPETGENSNINFGYTLPDIPETLLSQSFTVSP